MVPSGRSIVCAAALVFAPALACIDKGAGTGAKAQPSPARPAEGASPAEGDSPAETASPAPAAPPPSESPPPEFVAPAEGELPPAIRDALAAAERDDRRLVVYVGATWCEPCQAFHHALERGELNDALAGVRFVEFDSDRDGSRLGDAGYGGRYIPRFVVPTADGRGGPLRMEGGIKGDGAVAHIMERLGPLLARSTSP